MADGLWGDVQCAMASPLFGLIRVAHCALRRAGDVSVCQGSDDYQRLRPEAFARFVLGLSMPIAWPAVADGVAKGATRNMVIRDRFPLTGATWLMMVVAVIVWNSGIGFFIYGSIVGHRYGICKRGVGGINFAGFCGGRPDRVLGRAALGVRADGRRRMGGRQGQEDTARRGWLAKPPKTKRCRGSVSFQVV